MANEWGPLAGLIGDWESDRGGLDTAYSHSQSRVLETPYLEKCSFKPFGPVDNGDQHLYGLDYKSAMWRGDEDSPFHTEVGYWLWDSATGEFSAVSSFPAELRYWPEAPAVMTPKNLPFEQERTSPFTQ